MIAIWIGVLLIITGVTVAAVRTVRRGRLSSPPPDMKHATTLEPPGEGDRLSLFADLPGLGLVVAGAIILLLQAVM